MKYAVLNEKGTQVGYDFTCLSEAQTFISVNNGDAKGWYIKPMSEGTTSPKAQLLID